MEVLFHPSQPFYRHGVASARLEAVADGISRQWPRTGNRPASGVAPCRCCPVSVTLENAFHRSELPAYIDLEARLRPKIAKFAAIALLGPPAGRRRAVLSAARKAAQRLPPDPSELGDEDSERARDD